jgi:Ca2+:H+ antiporter
VVDGRVGRGEDEMNADWSRLGSLVEIIMFLVLILRKDDGVDYIQVIKAAILGSILATMLLCLGLCFVVGGLRRSESTFSEAVSEAGSGLLLTA